jgi:hypothetical protein
VDVRRSLGVKNRNKRGTPAIVGQKNAILIFVVLTAVVLIAACTSSTTNNSTQDLITTLNAHFAANYVLIENFTRLSELNETPVYSGIFQDENGTQRIVSVILANSSSDAQKLFDEQKEGLPTALNATFKTNTSAHFDITTNDTSFSGWVVQPKTVGPFGLSLDTAYVLVSQEVKGIKEVLPMTSETAEVVTADVAMTNETAAVVAVGVG